MKGQLRGLLRFAPRQRAGSSPQTPGRCIAVAESPQTLTPKPVAAAPVTGQVSYPQTPGRYSSGGKPTGSNSA